MNRELHGVFLLASKWINKWSEDSQTPIFAANKLEWFKGKLDG
jgi:hypothetical protein